MQLNKEWLFCMIKMIGSVSELMADCRYYLALHVVTEYIVVLLLQGELCQLENNKGHIERSFCLTSYATFVQYCSSVFKFTYI